MGCATSAVQLLISSFSNDPHPVGGPNSIRTRPNTADLVRALREFPLGAAEDGEDGVEEADDGLGVGALRGEGGGGGGGTGNGMARFTQR